MAFPSLGPFNNIVEDFTKSLNDVFGFRDKTENLKLGTVTTLVNPEGILSADTLGFKPEHWTGNTNRKGTSRLRYGFRIIADNDFKGNALGSRNQSVSTPATYYLDIPPQAISQKEIFATNITATRRGVVVESEGVVFKDIVIAGTTGVFPGARDSFGGNQTSFSDLTKAPARAGGVQDKGTSKSDTVVSGYAEFLGLRAFFLKYAQSKIEAKGRKFLVFINEKDQQALVVEPLEFTMERNSKNPMQYQYRIVLKCISTLDAAFDQLVPETDPASIINDIVNVSRNAVAIIQQFRSFVGATNRLVQSINQEIDKTFIQPLRLLGTALNDVADARANILAVSTILQRNLNEAFLVIAEARFTKSRQELIRDATVSSQNPTKVGNTNDSVFIGKISKRGSTDTFTSNNLLDKNKAENFVNSAIAALEHSSVTPLSKSFVQELRDKAQTLANDIADVVNLGNADFDTIQNRSPSFIPNPLRSATSNEFLLLGETLKLVAVLNQVLATNNLFLLNVQATFENDQALLKNIASIQAPTTVKEITIQHNDTLERVALREYGSVTRWVEIAVLNNLKYPYISDPIDPKIDGVKLYGDKLLIGN